MYCEACGRCRGIKLKGDSHIIACLEHGEFQLHQDYADTFQCEDFEEAPPIEEPPKDNIYIVLKCGREFTVYDKDISCNDDMQRRIHTASEKDRLVEFDGMLFNIDEIAVFSFIG